ncbi:MAG: aminomethyl-transferring glycine dehydrogenase subunit GcvPA [Candidatus Omnitrophota bacterium]
MSYISHTQEDKLKMLQAVGIQNGDIEKLFADIKQDLRPHSFNIPAGKSEYEVTKYIKGLANKNNNNLISFLGAGFYDHFIPAAVDALTSRSEFYTAYTPYQAEASQGTLQAIYEYQSAVSRLMGMEVANASLYDGGTAVYEAAMMAVRITGRNKLIIDAGVNPIYRKIVYTHTSNIPVELVEIPCLLAQSDLDMLNQAIDDKTAAVILANPDFFGTVYDYSEIIKKCHSFGVIAIMCVYPLSLGILKTPGEMDADIAVGEGQSLGLPLSFGGPYLGLMATKKEFVRKMPGRLVGATTDSDGKRGFVLTLQTREQHIRREKATSNICSNEALCALRTLIYMCLLGKDGLREVAALCFKKAEYLKAAIKKIKGAEVVNNFPTFNEFAVRMDSDPEKVVRKLDDKGFAAGLPLGQYYKHMKDCLLVSVTEKRDIQEIDEYVKALESAL